jgi:hypothetical protein
MKTSDNKIDSEFRIKRIELIVLILLFCDTWSFSQLPYQILTSDARSKFSEELYVSTDRSIYIAGEELYLKIYCIGRLTHNTSRISSVAYVSLLNRFNNPVAQVKIRINGTSGSGYFTLPDSLSTGNYTLATCTRWMQNFAPELFSYKNISVINPFSNTDNMGVPSGKPEVDTVIFYPESGNIIAGVENVIGFRCLRTNRDPVQISGVITDSINNILCQVQSDDDGFGLFSINPPGNSRLYLKISDRKMTSERFELPGANDSGVAVSISKSGEYGILKLKVLRGDNFNPRNRKYHLIYAPVSLAPFVLDTDPLTNDEIILKSNSLPSGLASIIFTDDTGHRYAERWLYNNTKPGLKISVKADKQFYSAREKVKIDIFTTDSADKPVESNLSVSVVRPGTLTETDTNPVQELQIPGLPVSKDKRGTSGINDGLIFLHTNKDLRESNTDLQKPVLLPEPDGHLITGTIRNTISGEPLRRENIILSFVGKTALCRFTKTDENGRFIFVSLEEGDREIVIQPLSPALDEYYVELDNPFPEAFTKSYTRTLNLDTGMLDIINKVIISMQVKRIYGPLLPIKSAPQKKISLNDFYGLPEFTTRMSDFIQLTSLREAIKEIVPGVVTTGRRGKTIINTIYKHNYQIETRDPIVIVDGVPVFDHEKVLNIPGDKIEKIDVLNMGYYISDISLDGVIDITTQKGDLSLIEFDKPVFRQEFEALQPESGFSSPDYSDVSQIKNRIPDFRNTVYWNPDVRTQDNGKTEVEFYTSDEPDDYILLVEGFTANGHRVSTTLHFSIKANK